MGSSVFWLFVLEVDTNFWRGSGWKCSCVWGLSGVCILPDTDGLYLKFFFLELHVGGFLSKKQPKFLLYLWAQMFLVRWPWLYYVFEVGAHALSLGYGYSMRSPIIVGVVIYASNSKVKKCHKSKQHAHISAFPCFAISPASQKRNTSQILSISLQGYRSHAV